MTRILHSSDLHGKWRSLLTVQDFDVWVDTGDFLPNISRGESIESAWQTGWLTLRSSALRKRFMPWISQRYGPLGAAMAGWYPPKACQPPEKSFPSVAAALTEWLAGRPAVCVSGNHDFTDVTGPLRAAGANIINVGNVHAVTAAGLTFAGFREIPYVTGEWAGEVGNIEDDPAIEAVFTARMAAVLGQNPDVLMTHTPPAGIMDFSVGKGGSCGSKAITRALQYAPHNVKAHLFGHVHECFGVEKEMDIIFSNAATGMRVLRLS